MNSEYDVYLRLHRLYKSDYDNSFFVIRTTNFGSYT